MGGSLLGSSRRVSGERRSRPAARLGIRVRRPRGGQPADPALNLNLSSSAPQDSARSGLGTCASTRHSGARGQPAASREPLRGASAGAVEFEFRSGAQSRCGRVGS